MKDFKLSEHFTFFELTNSKEHPELVEQNREAALQYQDVLTELCNNVLEPIRSLVNAPVIVTSGFRSDLLNKAASGNKSSQHLVGQAADFKVKGMTPAEVFELVKKSKIPYGQLILEYGIWIHVSLGFPYRTKEKSRQAIIVK